MEHGTLPRIEYENVKPIKLWNRKTTATKVMSFISINMEHSNCAVYTDPFILKLLKLELFAL